MDIIGWVFTAGFSLGFIGGVFALAAGQHSSDEDIEEAGIIRIGPNGYRLVLIERDYEFEAEPPHDP